MCVGPGPTHGVGGDSAGGFTGVVGQLHETTGARNEALGRGSVGGCPGNKHAAGNRAAYLSNQPCRRRTTRIRSADWSDRIHRQPGRWTIRNNGAVAIDRIAWIATVLVALLTAVLLLISGYTGYAGLGVAVAISAAINLL